MLCDGTLGHCPMAVQIALPSTLRTRSVTAKGGKCHDIHNDVGSARLLLFGVPALSTQLPVIR